VAAPAARSRWPVIDHKMLIISLITFVAINSLKPVDCFTHLGGFHLLHQCIASQYSSPRIFEPILHFERRSEFKQSFLGTLSCNWVPSSKGSGPNSPHDRGRSKGGAGQAKPNPNSKNGKGQAYRKGAGGWRGEAPFPKLLRKLSSAQPGSATIVFIALSSHNLILLLQAVGRCSN
jgi:hypothetical protein